MARLEDTPATDAEAARLKELMGFTREEADMLTPDERAEFLSDDDTSNPVAEQAAQDEKDGIKSDDRADPPGDESMPHEGKAELPVAEAVEEETPQPTDRFVPPPEVKAADAPADVTAVEDAPVVDPVRPRQRAKQPADDRDFAALRTELSTKFGDGDITNQEFTDQLAELVKGETIRDMRTDAQVEARQQSWLDQQEAFLADNPEYLPQSSQARFAALNDRVIALANDPANASKSGTWHLLEAQRLVEKEIGPAKAVAPTPPAAKPTPRRPELKSVPTTLAHVPTAASDAADGRSEFDVIDDLDGLAQEQAIARLGQPGDARYDAYLKRG